MNKYLLAVLFFLSINIAQADGIKYFADIPDKFTVEEAISVVKHVAVSRKWTFVKSENNKLRIYKEHESQTKSRFELEFSFSDHKISYTDLSTTFDNLMDKWVSGNKAPVNWMINLKNDTNNVFFIAGLNRN